MTTTKGQVLNRAGEDRSTIQPTTQSERFIVDQRNQMSFLAKIAQKKVNLFHNEFCTARETRGEPLMDQSNALRKLVQNKKDERVVGERYEVSQPIARRRESQDAG